MQEVNNYAHKNAVKLLVGNKSDLVGGVKTEEAQRKAEQYGVHYIETSAKTAEQVDSAFMSIARELVKKRQESGVPPVPRSNHLSSQPQVKSDNSCCT